MYKINKNGSEISIDERIGLKEVAKAASFNLFMIML